MQVAVANTTGDDSHEHLVANGLVNLDVFYGQRLMGAVEDGGFHAAVLRVLGGANLTRPARPCRGCKLKRRPGLVRSPTVPVILILILFSAIALILLVPAVKGMIRPVVVP